MTHHELEHLVLNVAAALGITVEQLRAVFAHLVRGDLETTHLGGDRPR